jgi:hypothetical protein
MLVSGMPRVDVKGKPWLPVLDIDPATLDPEGRSKHAVLRFVCSAAGVLVVGAALGL